MWSRMGQRVSFLCYLMAEVHNTYQDQDQDQLFQCLLSHRLIDFTDLSEINNTSPWKLLESGINENNRISQHYFYKRQKKKNLLKAKTSFLLRNNGYPNSFVGAFRWVTAWAVVGTWHVCFSTYVFGYLKQCGQPYLSSFATCTAGRTINMYAFLLKFKILLLLLFLLV